MAKVFIGVRLDPDALYELDEQADREGRKRSELIRDAIDMYLDLGPDVLPNE